MKNPYLLNTHDLPRRAGEMKEYELDIEAPERVGVPLIGVAQGDIIEVDARLESVTEGVLLSATASKIHAKEAEVSGSYFRVGAFVFYNFKLRFQDGRWNIVSREIRGAS